MEKAYKDGAIWVINQYKLGANTCIGVESTDGLRFDIKLLATMETIASGLYTEYVDGTETAYSKETLIVFFQDFFFRVGGTDSTGFFTFPVAGGSGLKVRIGSRTGFVWAVDQELTVTGFAGDEGTDWENIAGN